MGKTTVAASLGALAARSGRRTLVATIDPAPRLADALGLGSLSADPVALPATACRALGIPEGSLSAARIDPALSFRRLVEAKVDDPEMRRRIFTNPIYRQMTTVAHRVAGVRRDPGPVRLPPQRRTTTCWCWTRPPRPTPWTSWTPPTGSPRRCPARWSAGSPAAAEGAGRFSLRRLGSGGALVLPRLGKFVGSQFLDDLGAFLADFQGVLGGFLERATAIETLLRRPDVGFLLVLAPELPAVEEALYFHRRLRAGGFSLDAFVANRVLPAPGLVGSDSIRRELGLLPPVAGLSPDDAGGRQRPGRSGRIPGAGGGSPAAGAGPPAPAGPRGAADRDPAAGP